MASAATHSFGFSHLSLMPADKKVIEAAKVMMSDPRRVLFLFFFFLIIIIIINLFQCGLNRMFLFHKLQLMLLL